MRKQPPTADASRSAVEAPPPLDDERLARLDPFRDLLLPAEDGLPSATEADPSGRFVRRAWDLVPRQAGLVADWLETADPAGGAAALAELERADPETFEALANLVFGAHLSNRKVWKRIDYPGRKPRLPYPDEAESFLEDGILRPVEERGRFLRNTE